MREIGKVPSGRDAARLADYLLTLGIRTRVEENAGAATIWVYEEDQRERAQQELDAFNRDPADSRYEAAAGEAKSLERQAAALDKRYRKNVIDVRQRWSSGRLRSRPVTLLLLAISLAVGVTTNFGDAAPTDALIRELWITPPVAMVGDGATFQGLGATLRGQWWRLVTPIFIHHGILHLVFNMFLLIDLGTLIELRRGSPRMLLLVLALAISSNLAEFYWSGPWFGGMSGVGYGLFGYAWMKSRFDPASGFFLHPTTVFILMVWFVLCLAGRVGDVANAAHTAGLLVGMAIALAPVVGGRLRF